MTLAALALLALCSQAQAQFLFSFLNPFSPRSTGAPQHTTESGPTTTVKPSSTSTTASRTSPTTSASIHSETPKALYDYKYDFAQIPYQVNPYYYKRGPQSGYNQCNGTQSSADSQCQTLIVNTLEDFCLWGAPYKNALIGDAEAAMVAFCTKDTHGGRPIAKGAFKGVQMLKTNAYIQITGLIDQTAFNLNATDYGGELDPHGADLLGNPLGALVYSNNLPTTQNKVTQAVSWNQFIGGSVFCIKLCDNSISNPNYCENRFDLIGCEYNMPASYADGEFSECESELQDPAGVYTGKDGRVTTWSQPPEPMPENYTMPYTARVPKSSSCTYYRSEDLFDNKATTAKPVSTDMAIKSASHTTVISDGSIVHTSAPAKAAAAPGNKIDTGSKVANINAHKLGFRKLRRNHMVI